MSKIGLDLRFWRLQTAGLGRYSRNLAAELLKLDQTNSYTIFITPADEAEFALSAPNLVKRVVDIGHYSLSEQINFNKVLAEERFDLVHFANFNHPVFYSGRFVVTIHDLIMDLFPTGAQQKSFIRRLAYNWVMNDCRRAKRVIVPSQSTKSDLIEKRDFAAEKIVVTPEGSEEIFRPASVDSIKELKVRLNLPEKYLLFVSRWERYKGLPILLKAFEAITKEFPEVGLVITGRPDKQNPEIAQLVFSAQKKGQKIITPGFISDQDLNALYSGASAYVHPSLYEGFGIMILEAFAAGVPVVASNTSSLPEVVGDAGLLVDPRDVNDLVQKVSSLLKDEKLANSLRQKGLDRVKQYSWKTMASKTLDVYKEVLVNT